MLYKAVISINGYVELDIASLHKQNAIDTAKKALEEMTVKAHIGDNEINVNINESCIEYLEDEQRNQIEI